jgi:hypothetical protein
MPFLSETRSIVEVIALGVAGIVLAVILVMIISNLRGFARYLHIRRM